MNDNQEQNGAAEGGQEKYAFIPARAGAELPQGSGEAGHHEGPENAELAGYEGAHIAEIVFGMRPVRIGLGMGEGWETVRGVPGEIRRNDQEGKEQHGA